MRARPKGRYQDENGVVDLVALFTSNEPDFPECIAWDKAYADEADRLATLEADKTGKRHWGRWYLGGKGRGAYLATRAMRPAIEEKPIFYGGVYDIALSRCGSESLCAQWIEHMEEKTWLGEQGMTDLKQAFADLRMDGLIR